MGLKVRAYEAGSGVGGTWFWNRYPGARCDVESLEYSYSFSNELQQEWKWPERYGTQPEILKYINHVADRFDLRRDVQLNTRIVSASFDGKAGEWTLKTDGGEEIRARYCVMAAGNLSTPRVPDFKGLKNFKGKWYHSGLWPHEGVDFTRPARRRDRHRLVGRADDPDHRQPGQAPDRLPAHRQLQPAGAQWADGARARAAGTRPSIRRAAPRRPTRRSPSAAMPSRPGRRSTSPEDERNKSYEAKWQEGGSISYLYAYTDLLVNKQSNDTASEFVRNKIRAIVKDKRTGELAGAQGPSDRHQAALPRYQLLRDLQPRQRQPGRRAQRSDRGDHRDRPAHRTAASRSSSTPSSSRPASTP